MTSGNMAYWIEYNITESIWTLPQKFRWHRLPYESCLRPHCQSFKTSLDFDMASNTELFAAGALGVLAHNPLFTHGLARHPENLQKLQIELDSLDSASDFIALQHCPHLNGILNEILRLHPATLTGIHRETPPEVL